MSGRIARELPDDEGRPEPSRLTGPMPSDPGYIYHATNHDRLWDIIRSRRLNTHRAHEFTDQDVWPDGSTERRNYFTPTAANTYMFRPEEGHGALLRLMRSAHPVKAERGTGDLYSTTPVHAKHLEYHTVDNAWEPVLPRRR